MPNGNRWLIFFLVIIGAVFLWQARGVIGQRVTQLKQVTEEVVPTGVGGDQALVEEVLDGVTVKLQSGETVRYIGLEVDPCFADQAKQRNESLVKGKIVKLEADVQQKDTEGRWLRYVWLNGVMVNEQLAGEGYVYAKYIKPNVLRQEVVILAQNRARDMRLGVWKSCQK